jgi:cytidyltransferase-like protein
MVVTIDGLADIRIRHPGEKIVLTSGCFDLLHVGHVRYLQTLKRPGTIVVVLISADHRARIQKGEHRPIMPATDRAEMVAALKTVDYAIVDPSKQPPFTVDPIYQKILELLQPHHYITYCEDGRFSPFVDKSKLPIAKRVEGGRHKSTTDIIEYVRTMPLGTTAQEK